MSWRIFSFRKRTEGLLTSLGGLRPTILQQRAVDRALLLQHNRTSVLSHLDPERELVLHNLLLPQQEADPDQQSSPSSRGGGGGGGFMASLLYLSLVCLQTSTVTPRKSL